MTYDYSRLRGTADRLLARFGVSATLIRAGGVDESTYPVTPASPKREPCMVLRDTYSAADRSGTLIAEGDVKLLIAATVSAPTTADRIEIAGQTYALQSVEPIQPGAEVLLYQARGRS